MAANHPVRAPHILVAEDNAVLCAELARELREEGFVVSEAYDVPSIFRAIDENPVDLLTLDVGMAGPDGFRLALQIRAARNLPIIMITGRDSPADRLAGLEHGADDYITKPFMMREAVLRVRAALARYGLNRGHDGRRAAPESTARVLEFGGAVLDLRARTLQRPGAPVAHLTETEFQVLQLLLSHPERVFSRDEISLGVWGREWSPLDRSVDVHVARLRRKIGDDDDGSRLIRSVRGVGYVFVGDVASGADEGSIGPPRPAQPREASLRRIPGAG